MSARRKGRDVHGVFLLDKPAGISSNQALQKVRRILNARKAGHTGTLDPFATGMLPICLGDASKTAGLIMAGQKKYLAKLKLGVATATGDTEGEVVDTCPVPELNLANLESALAHFRGKFEQVPPMYSAIKQDGKPLYELARQGIVVERKARPVEIHSLELDSWEPPLLEFEVTCSKGTYIRTLAEDIAEKLGTCGHLLNLRRLEVEPFDGALMHGLEDLEHALDEGRGAELLLPADSGLPSWPVVVLKQEQLIRFMHGNMVDFCAEPGKVRVHGSAENSPTKNKETILGLGEIRADGKLYPVRVFSPGVLAEASLPEEV
jgi:tRNA pseudouridine55 synthase